MAGSSKFDNLKFSLVALAMVLPSSAVAADAVLDARFGEEQSGEPIYDTVVYWSADYSNTDEDEYGLNAGFVTALNGDLGKSGWTISANLGGSYSDGSTSDSKSYYGSLLLGYLWANPYLYFSLGAGPVFVSNNSSPSSPSDDSDVGAILQYGIDTTKENNLYFQSYGSYATVKDQIYLHAKAGYKTSSISFGPEITYFDDNQSTETLRYGAFVGDISLFDRLSMTVSAGYQDESGSSDGFYATVGFSVPLSLRN